MHWEIAQRFVALTDRRNRVVAVQTFHVDAFHAEIFNAVVGVELLEEESCGVFDEHQMRAVKFRESLFVLAPHQNLRFGGYGVLADCLQILYRDVRTAFHLNRDV